MDCSLPGSSVLLLLPGFPGKNTGSGLPFHLPGDLPDPGIELTSLVSPAMINQFFTAEPPENPLLPQSIFQSTRPG